VPAASTPAHLQVDTVGMHIHKVLISGPQLSGAGPEVDHVSKNHVPNHVSNHVPKSCPKIMSQIMSQIMCWLHDNVPLPPNHVKCIQKTSSKFDICMLAKRGGRLANVDTEFHRLSQIVVRTWANIFIISFIINLVLAL
jgi:hypothetical protein